MPLSRDEARVRVVPTLTAALGGKGHRPAAGTWDNKDVLSVPAALDVVPGAPHANTPGSVRAAGRRAGEGKTRRTRRASAAHRRHVGRVYPAATHRRVALILDNAPGHRGGRVDEALRDDPHPEFYRLPRHGPCRNRAGRFRGKLGRRATHNRLFDSSADLKRSVRGRPSHFPTVREKTRSLVRGRHAEPTNQTQSPGT